MRKLPRFDYWRPESFADALQILLEGTGRNQPLAGGTDLFVAMKEKGAAPAGVIDLKGIRDFDFIRETDGRIEIGALATIRSIEVSPLIREKLPFLAEAAGKLGSVQIRNKATVGGNLCNAAPSAETAPALLCAGALAEVLGPEGSRTIPLEGFFTGPGQTVLNRSALLTKIVVPQLPPHSAGAYFKLSPRRAMDLAVVGTGCLLAVDAAKKKCLECRIVLGAVAPVPLRARGAEAFLRGREITPGGIEEAAQAAAQEARPISDVRGSAEYRKAMVEILVRWAVGEALKRIR